MQNLSKIFSSKVAPQDCLLVSQAHDYDIWVQTRCAYNETLPTSIRLRTYAGGGRNLLIHRALSVLWSKNSDAKQPDLLDELYWKDARPEIGATRLTVHCDDNPGSALRLYVSEKAFALQTLCFNENANCEAGNSMTQKGEGPVVWLSRELFPHIHKPLYDLVQHRKLPEDFTSLAHSAYHPVSFEK